MSIEPMHHVVGVWLAYEYDEVLGVYSDLEEAKNAAVKGYADMKASEDHLGPDGAYVTTWQGSERLGNWRAPA